ncbi:MAG: addiction module toxin RelE [Anaerolineaceae bacterium]|nr:addiction module toxin RelE [Anaerolineaceae bacterium]
MEFIETSIFAKYIYNYLTEDEYFGLQCYLFLYPESRKIIKGTGGVRKLRWTMQNIGKSGGVRVIYYYKNQQNEIWLLTIYKKSELEIIPAHILKRIAEEIKNV